MGEVFTSRSVEETFELGRRLSLQAAPDSCFVLTGDLGAGKTHLSKGFAAGLGVTEEITSPTFAIVNEYDTESFRVCHFDMYRILDEDMLYDIGWDDYLDGDAVLLIEWSENITEALPDDCVTVEILHGDTENSRMITIHGGILS